MPGLAVCGGVRRPATATPKPTVVRQALRGRPLPCVAATLLKAPGAAGASGVARRGAGRGAERGVGVQACRCLATGQRERRVRAHRQGNEAAGRCLMPSAWCFEPAVNVWKYPFTLRTHT